MKTGLNNVLLPKLFNIASIHRTQAQQYCPILTMTILKTINNIDSKALLNPNKTVLCIYVCNVNFISYSHLLVSMGGVKILEQFTEQRKICIQYYLNISQIRFLQVSFVCLHGKNNVRQVYFCGA